MGGFPISSPLGTHLIIKQLFSQVLVILLTIDLLLCLQYCSYLREILDFFLLNFVPLVTEQDQVGSMTVLVGYGVSTVSPSVEKLR